MAGLRSRGAGISASSRSSRVDGLAAGMCASMPSLPPAPMAAPAPAPSPAPAMSSTTLVCEGDGFSSRYHSSASESSSARRCRCLCTRRLRAGVTACAIDALVGRKYDGVLGRRRTLRFGTSVMASLCPRERPTLPRSQRRYECCPCWAVSVTKQVWTPLEFCCKKIHFVSSIILESATAAGRMVSSPAGALSLAQASLVSSPSNRRS